MLLLTAVIFGCSIDRDPKLPDVQVETPPEFRIETEVLSSTDDCDNGGLRVITYLDEVVQTDDIVCNGVNGSDGQDGSDGVDGQDGVDGVNSLTIQEEFESNDECPNGGVEIKNGLDFNRNNTLEEEEISSVVTICNGIDGEDGQNGNDGEDGCNAISVIIKEPAGDNCEFGGYYTYYGVDCDDNRLLEGDEIIGEEYYCFEEKECDSEIIEDFEMGFDDFSVFGKIAYVSENRAMLFDTDNPTGGDYDLGVNQGNAFILSEDGDLNDPDDNAGGGVLTFTFIDPVNFTSLEVIDFDESHNYIKTIGVDGSVKRIDIPRGSNGSVQEIFVDADNIRKLLVVMTGSGAVDNLKYNKKCKW